MKAYDNERLSSSQKNANKKEWYKAKSRQIAHEHNSLRDEGNGPSEYKRMLVNYNIFNNELDLNELRYVCQPKGDKTGELPARMVNRDISSGKIKAVLGMEMKRPFSYKAVAVNPEATTRKEKEKFSQIQKFVTNSILQPIRVQLETEMAQQQQEGKELSQEEQQAIQQKIEQEMKVRTPLEVKKYMEREHQDPAEAMAHQLLEYLIQKTDVRRKFNKCFKHLNLSAKEIMYVGIHNGEPQVWPINSLRVNYQKSSMSDLIEDSERMSAEYRMAPSEIINYFGDELSNSDIDKIYSYYKAYDNEDLFDRADRYEDSNDLNDSTKISVIHTLWKSLRKIAFLTYLDKNQEEQMMMVDESYKLNPENGDLNIEYEWLPESYETWKIAGDIYVYMRPIPGQFKDINNLHQCKFPYIGMQVDDMNSRPTSLMDRLKVYQYYYNIIMYRVELLISSDKGKKVLMNINAIPDSEGIDLDKWQYFFESSPFMWFNPNEEGTGYNDVNTMAKTIDLSLASDIGKYIDFAEYLKRQAGISVGITEAVEGQASPGESVGNNRQNLVQTSHILEPYFEIHNTFKKNVLTALLETAKIAYSGKDAVKLSYVLDDMSVNILELDPELLENSTYGLFVSNSSKSQEALDTIKQLSHAAMQNQKADLSDVLALLRQDGVIEAEETLKVAEKNKREEAAQAQAAQGEQQKEIEKMKQEAAQKLHENEKEIVVLKEEEKRKTVLQQSALMGMSYNPDADADNDGQNDFLEIAKHGVDAEIKRSENQLEREKFEHQKEVDREEISIKKKEANNKSKK